MAILEICKCGHPEVVHNDDMGCLVAECDCYQFECKVTIKTKEMKYKLCIVCNAQMPDLDHSVCCSYCKSVLDTLVEQVEDIVGMGHGAWDMVRATDILAATIKVLKDKHRAYISI